MTKPFTAAPSFPNLLRAAFPAGLGLAILVGAPDQAWAEPYVVSDGELDRISASGSASDIYQLHQAALIVELAESGAMDLVTDALFNGSWLVLNVPQQNGIVHSANASSTWATDSATVEGAGMRLQSTSFSFAKSAGNSGTPTAQADAGSDGTSAWSWGFAHAEGGRMNFAESTTIASAVPIGSLTPGDMFPDGTGVEKSGAFTKGKTSATAYTDGIVSLEDLFVTFQPGTTLAAFVVGPASGFTRGFGTAVGNGSSVQVFSLSAAAGGSTVAVTGP